MNQKYDVDSLREAAVCILTYEQTLAHIKALADEVNDFYKNEEVVVWTVLNGAIVFSGLFLTHLTMPLTTDYVHATRYNQNVASEGINWLARPAAMFSNKHVLICDDIFDAGVTGHYLRQYALLHHAKSVKLAVMAKKNTAVQSQFPQPEFVAFEVPDRYVFGMGMDYNGYWRNAAGIWVEKVTP